MDTTENTTPTETGREKRLRPGGGYRRLRSFQLSTIIYDATVSFCDRFIDHSARTHDRMVQAARSGRQNIAASGRESAGGSTTETDMRAAARNSFDELLLDYEDFLRQRKLRAWARDDSEAQAVRNIELKHERSEAHDPFAYAAWLEHKDPAVVANALICLILQTDFLLVGQAAAQGYGCISLGSEKLTSSRIAAEPVMKHPTNPSEGPDLKDAPACKICGKAMVLRTARKGKQEGRSFWGCTGYPECKATMPRKNHT